MNSVKRTAVIITIISLLCKIIGFFKNSVLAYYYGSSPIVDAYVMVFAIGNIIFGWIGGFTGNFIPIFSEVLEKHGSKEADRFVNNLRNWLSLVIVLLIIIFEVFGESIVTLVAPGFSGETLAFTVSFWRIYCFSLLFSLIYRLYKEYLNSKSLFVKASAPDLLMSSLIIVAIVVSAYTENTFLIWGYVVAIAIEAIIELLFSISSGHRPALAFSFDDNIKLVLVTVFPIFVSDCLTEINTFVDKIFASQLSAGSVAILDYAGTLKNIFLDVGVVAITTIIYPKLSEYWVKGNKVMFVDTVLNGLKIVFLLFVPLTFGIIILGDNIVNIILKRGAFDDTSARLTTTALVMYSIGLLAMVIRLVMNRAFLAMRKTKVVMITGVVNLIVNVAMNYLLITPMGHNGLALATSLAAIAVTITYLGIFLKEMKVTNYGRQMIFVFKIFFASALMGVVVWYVKHITESIMYSNLIYEILFSGVLTIVGCIAYYLLLKLLRVREIEILLKR